MKGQARAIMRDEGFSHMKKYEVARGCNAREPLGGFVSSILNYSCFCGHSLARCDDFAGWIRVFARSSGGSMMTSIDREAIMACTFHRG